MSSKNIIKLASVFTAKYKLAQDRNYRTADKSIVINEWKSEIQSDSYLLNQKFDLPEFSFSIPEIKELSFIGNGTPVSLKVKIHSLLMNVGPSMSPKSNRFVSQSLYAKAPGIDYFIEGEGRCKVLLPMDNNIAADFLVEGLLSRKFEYSNAPSFLSTEPYTLRNVELHQPILLNYSGVWKDYLLPTPDNSSTKEKSFFKRFIEEPNVLELLTKFSPDVSKKLESQIFTPQISNTLITIMREKIASFPSLNLEGY